MTTAFTQHAAEGPLRAAADAKRSRGARAGVRDGGQLRAMSAEDGD